MVISSFPTVAEVSRGRRVVGVCMGLLSTGARVARKRRILRIGILLLAGSVFGAGSLVAQVNFGSAGLGTTTPVTQTVTLTSGIGGNSPIIASISVLTQGAPNLDYTNAGGGTCATGQSLTTGQTCTVVVNFKPKVAGARYGAVVLLDSGGYLIATVYLQGTGTGPQIIFSPPTQSYVGHGLNSTAAIAVDGAGAVYVSDPTSGWVVKYTPSGDTYVRSVISGGDSGTLAVDGAGNVYFSDPNYKAAFEIVPIGGGNYQGRRILICQ